MKVKILRIGKAINAALFVLLLVVVGSKNAFAQSFAVGNMNYTVNDDGISVTVTGLSNNNPYYGAINIPEEVSYNDNTYSVTRIAASAFINCTGITSVTIPSSMTFIGDMAFSGCSGLITLNYNATNCSLGSYDYSWYSYYHWLDDCSSLVSLNIGTGVQTIPDYFVCYRSSFTGSVIIPNSVTTIGEDAFYGCSNIGSVSIGDSVTSIGEYAFCNCSNMGSVTIGSSVASIGASAFSNCGNLTAVVLPSSMTSISNYTFDGCSMLSSVTIPNAVVSIGNYAFSNTGLASVVIPNSVVSISEGAFYDCGSLASLSLGESVASIGAYAFYNCSNLATLVVPNSVVSIGNSAFYGCSHLSSATIGNTVASIGASAFENCTGLTSVALGGSVASIGNEAFHGCTSLPTITIPASVTSIGTDVFGGCTALGQITVASGNTVYDSRNNCNAIIMSSANKLVTGCKNTVIPNTVTVIGNKAFYSCIGLSGTLNIPNSVTIIEPYAFYGCIGISGALNLPNSIVRIKENAFQNCTGISSVTIPSSMTFIGDMAFSGCSGLITLNYNATNCSLGSYDYSWYSYYHWLDDCSSLVSLNIGTGVQTIPNWFVYVCNSLTGSVVIPNSVTTIGEYAFYGCSNIGSVSIGNSATSIGENAFNSCSNMGSLTIGSSVASIGVSAFANCSNLTTVVLPSSMTSISEDTFYNCSLLSSVTIPNTIVSIGSWAFGNTALASVVIPNSVVSISESAFRNCSSLASVNLGESVASIWASAFYDCSNIASISVYANNPPVVLSNAFYNVSRSIPVQIPCNTLSAYQTASVWSSFTNMQENCDPSFDITVMVSPSVGGTVTGGGSYNQGETCTLTATANTGYTFINWTKNGTVVSTNAEYSFTVTETATYLANFNQNQSNSYTITATANPIEGGFITGAGSYNQGATCTLTATANTGYTFINWTENGNVVSTNSTFSFTVMDNRTLVAHFDSEEMHWTPEYSQYEDNMTFTCIVQLDGEEQYTTMLEVGAFCGEECRGSQRATYFVPTQHYIIQMTVFGEVNDVISFRLYDHQLQQELLLTPPADIIFNTNGYGSLFAPYVLNFTSTVTHTQVLNSGWSWWSTYVELNNNDGLSQLENSIGSAGIIIKSRTNGYVEAYQYNGETNWYGTLNSINNEQMYKIRTNETCNATIEGALAVPENHPININNGWNWIGFPCNQNVNVEVAMSGFTPENNDVIKGRYSFTTYYSDGNYNMWYGTLNTLEAGKGYMYRSNSSTQKTLVFQTGRGETAAENITTENNVFYPSDENFADNMTLTAVVDIDSEELRSEDYELATFVGDECRGSVKLMYVEPVDRYVAFLTVFGEPFETLHFRLTDGTQTELSADKLVFEADGMVGTLSEPVTLHFGMTKLDENELSKVMVYPNPSKGVFNIQGQSVRKVEVFNAFGQIIVSEETSKDHLQIDLSRYDDGCYLLRVVTDNGVTNSQLIKR